MYSEHSQYHDNFHARVRMAEFCGGEDCKVWFHSEVDTWHECPCNSKKGYAHPEAEFENAYVVTAVVRGRVEAIGLYARMDHGKAGAREAVLDEREGVQLRRIRGDGSPEFALAQKQVSMWSDLWH